MNKNRSRGHSEVVRMRRVIALLASAFACLLFYLNRKVELPSEILNQRSIFLSAAVDASQGIQSTASEALLLSSSSSSHALVLADLPSSSNALHPSDPTRLSSLQPLMRRLLHRSPLKILRKLRLWFLSSAEKIFRPILNQVRLRLGYVPTSIPGTESLSKRVNDHLEMELEAIPAITQEQRTRVYSAFELVRSNDTIARFAEEVALPLTPHLVYRYFAATDWAPLYNGKRSNILNLIPFALSFNWLCFR